MLPPLSDIEALAVRLPAGTDLGDEDAWAAAALEDASTLVRTYVGLTWVDDENELTDVPDIVVTVVLAVAARALNRSLTYGAQSAPETGLFLKKQEKASLDRLRPGTRSPLWTLPTTRCDPTDDTVYVDVVGSEPFPLYDAEDAWPASR